MFFQDPRVPRDVLTEVLRRLPKKDRLTMRLTCKRFRDCTNSLFWREAKAKDINDFFQRFRKLPVACKRLILMDNCQYTFEFVEKIVYVLSLPVVERFQELSKCERVKEEDVLLLPGFGYKLSYLALDCLVIALYAGLITPAQVVDLNSRSYLNLFFCNEHGLKALQENLFDLMELVQVVSKQKIEILLSDGGLLALRQKAITLDDVSRIKTSILRYLLTPHGIIALQEKVITLEQVMATGSLAFFLLNAYCITALKENLFTLEQVKCVRVGALKCLMTASGMTALRESLITIEQVIKIGTGCLRYLLTNKGIESMRAGRITPEKANEMNLNDLEKFLGVKQFTGKMTKM